MTSNVCKKNEALGNEQRIFSFDQPSTRISLANIFNIPTQSNFLHSGVYPLTLALKASEDNWLGNANTQKLSKKELT